MHTELATYELYKQSNAHGTHIQHTLLASYNNNNQSVATAIYVIATYHTNQKRTRLGAESLALMNQLESP